MPDDRQLLIDYLLMKARAEDWHAVADAAMDLREWDAARRQPTPVSLETAHEGRPAFRPWW